MADDWLKTHCEVDRAFDLNQVGEATDQDLQRWLQKLCTGNVPNETIRHREIVRGLTINHLQMSRTIRNLEGTMLRLNAANDKTQHFIVRLTWIAVCVGVVQAIAAVITIMR